MEFFLLGKIKISPERPIALVSSHHFELLQGSPVWAVGTVIVT